jgi:cytochrome c-type biogenesis protein CcmF
MPPIDVPFVGNLLLGAILLAACWTLAVSLAAARGRPHLLPAVRGGMYATIATVFGAVFLLAYAFQAHDFRIRYVLRYSDRTMDPTYLWTALWGGQDGSLLWWLFLLCVYALGFTLWIRRRHEELQPWVFAVLSSIQGFFGVLMLFAANPFATGHAATAPVDGEGLNPLLQNYWMAIHPPALYMGLTGWAIPFSLCAAALITGRLSDEWIHAARRWTLLAWAFLTLGNMLGMFWSYEELGWGGYWAWDPVENASFMPWLFGTAYLHSVMIQERRGMLRVWNVALMCGAFFFTIFGTFLTRSGLIASVHSFARSDIGIWFAWYMVILALSLITLVAWRLPELRGRGVDVWDFVIGLCIGVVPGIIVAYAALVLLVRERVTGEKTPASSPPGRIESLLSREFAFLLNNWILLGMLVFVLVATTFPLLSEAVRGETITVGPGYYNQWMIPLAMCLLFLMGVGPVIAWRKATGKNLVQAFTLPAGAALVVMVLHGALGTSMGFPAHVESTEIYETTTGAVLAFLHGFSPIVCSTLCAFVLGTVFQEFWRGTRVRMKNANEPPHVALVELVSRARRRYGGYIVHVGVVFACFGFMGAAWDIEREATLSPGETMDVGGYTVRFDGIRDETDPGKDMLFADLTLMEGEAELGTLSPAKFVYRTHPDMPTTEVAIDSGPLVDFYAILSSFDAESGRVTLRALARWFVWWIWVGGLVALLGTLVAAFPSLREVLGEEKDEARPPRGMSPAFAGALVLLAVGAALAIALFAGTASAQSDSSSTLHASTVEIHDPTERQLFERLLCRCGDCPRLPLSTCGCGWAEEMRAELRGRLAAGATVVDIAADYRSRFGSEAIAIPSDAGLDRALWAVPVVGIVLALAGVTLLARRWRAEAAASPAASTPSTAGAAKGDYDSALEDELNRFED